MSDPARTPRRRRGRGAPVLLAAMVIAGAGAVVAEVRGDDPPGDHRVFILPGRGFGHGVGMSQWGARRAAQEGLSADQILTYYYSGVDVTTHQDDDVRVKLVEDVAEVSVSHEGEWHLVTDAGDSTTRQRTLRVTRDGADIVVRDPSGAETARTSSAVTFEAAREPIGVDGRTYRGTIRIVPTATGLDVINTVPVEQYLRSVISREMSPDWAADAAQALRAQAIVARTYALANLSPGRDFDLMDDTRSQVYGGVLDEDPRTDAAVRATRGQVLTYRGALITAFYSASSGGHTEDGDRVFPAATSRPYLKGIVDRYDGDAPLHRWPSPPTFTPAELSARLKIGAPIRGVDILEHGASPRVFRARVDLYPFGGVVLSGATIRARLDLPDTWFSVVTRPTGPDGAPTTLPRDAPRSDVWLAVLNGSTTTGAAARMADTAEEHGYVAVFAGNADAHAGPTSVYFAPGAEDAARRVAEDLSVTGPVRPLSDADDTSEAPRGAHVVVVIGTGSS